MIPAEAVEAARPFVSSFMERRGFELKGQETEVLIGYVLEAAAPYMLADANKEKTVTESEARTEREELASILHGEGAYCGSCGYEDGQCSDCKEVLAGYADAIRAAGYRKVAK